MNSHRAPIDTKGLGDKEKGRQGDKTVSCFSICPLVSPSPCLSLCVLRRALWLKVFIQPGHLFKDAQQALRAIIAAPFGLDCGE